MLLFLLLLTTPSFASQDNPSQVSEYHRLHQEMESLASRQAWAGVERAWQALVDTGVEPTEDDLLIAAHAALERGELAAARERVLLIAGRVESRQAIDILVRIDGDYGRVVLRGAEDLVGETKPFLPEAAAAVRFATEQVESTGAFAGYLPPGRYRFGMEIIEVQPGETTELVVEKRKRRKAMGTW